MEWLDTWWEERKGTRYLVGGAWGQGEKSVLHIGGGWGASPDRVTGECGIRLVLTMGE